MALLWRDGRCLSTGRSGPYPPEPSRLRHEHSGSLRRTPWIPASGCVRGRARDQRIGHVRPRHAWPSRHTSNITTRRWTRNRLCSRSVPFLYRIRPTERRGSTGILTGHAGVSRSPSDHAASTRLPSARPPQSRQGGVTNRQSAAPPHCPAPQRLYNYHYLSMY